ncbi:MAG: hypothetical protein ACJA00_000611 [Myxococcota bacterium]|jgi:hypothetical protein
MATLLHTPDALETLAEQTDEIGAWARQRLTVLAPERALATGLVGPLAPLLGSAGVRAVLQNKTASERGVALMYTAGLGGLNPDDDALIAALTAQLGGRDAPSVVYAAYLLAWCERLPNAALAKVVTWTANRPLTAATVVLYAPNDPTAKAVVAELDDSQLLPFIEYLGAPRVDLDTVLDDDATEPADVVAAGLTLGSQRSLVDLRKALNNKRRRGSAHSRGRTAGMSVLTDAEGALAVALRAIFSAKRHTVLGEFGLLYAGWTRAFTDGDPTQGVIGDIAHGRPDVLGRARAQTPNREAILAGLMSDVPGALPLSLDVNDENVAREALASWMRCGGHVASGPHYLHMALRAAAQAPDALLTYLAQPETRILAYRLAGVVTTEEVVEALLALSVPVEPHERIAYARCLVETGDRAVIPILRPLLQEGVERDTGTLANALFT